MSSSSSSSQQQQQQQPLPSSYPPKSSQVAGQTTNKAPTFNASALPLRQPNSILKTPTNASPQRSRDASPSRALKCTSGLPTSQESQQKSARSGVSTPTRPLPTSVPRIPRPVSLNEASNKVLQSRMDTSQKQWPISSHLKSPSSSRRNSAASKPQSDADMSDPENTPKASRMISSIPLASQGPLSPQMQTNAANANGTKTPRTYSNIAAKLETVEEGDQSTPPSDPHPLTQQPSATSNRPSAQRELSSDLTQVTNAFDLKTIDGSKDTESESDASRKSTDKAKMQAPKSFLESQSVTQNPPKKSISSASTKPRPYNEQSTSSMTVETETVPSIPQTSVPTNGDGKSSSGKRDDSGSLRTRPSTETIRPRKERKKVTQKRPSVVSGTASTKADIFEAKILSAAEDDSDSDETFVYESNPPEPRTTRRHHSRTLSGASTRSFADRRNTARSQNLLETHRSIKNKRSMKFASHSFAPGSDGDENEDGHGTIRLHRGRLNGVNDNESQFQSASGNWSGGSERTPVGDESPFSAASKARSAAARSGATSPRHSPKFSPPPYSNSPSKGWSGSPVHWDQSRTATEQQPLLGSLRAQRTRPSRRPHNSNLRHIEYYQEPARPWARRCSLLMAILVFVCLLAMTGGGMIYSTMRPLYNVSILEIQNVLASEEELMVDLNCVATNPNIIAVSITDSDLNIFAKSKYVGTDTYWRHHGAPEPVPQWPRKGNGRLPFITSQDFHLSKGVDEGTDPIGDPDSDPQTMFLGRVYHFDNSLTFEATPLLRSLQNQTGEIRLEKPGNKTEAGGSERWEKVIQHPFQLIVRGVLKYTLPFNTKVFTASIGKSITVDPVAGVPKIVKTLRI